MADCQTDVLLAQAKCFQACVSSGLYYPLKLALLCQIAQGLDDTIDCSVNSLLQRGNCFNCLLPGQQMILKLAIMCSIISAAGGGGPAVLAAPRNLSMTGVTSTSATVNWEYSPPEPTLDFQIQIDIDAAFPSPHTFTVSPSTRNYTQSFNPSTHYYIRIRARNSTDFTSEWVTIDFTTLT